MSRPSKRPPPEVAELDQIAARLSGRLRRGEPLVYCTGSLTQFCGAGATTGEVQRAWRRVRAAAKDALEAGRVALVQRRTGDVTEYLAVGLEGR